MRWAFVVMVGACYSPTIPTGAPCDGEHPCPRPLICTQSTATCERSELDAGDDAPAVDAPPIPGCMPTGFDVCGDGLDQDCDGADEVCAVNDLAPDAINVTAGGSFTGDLLLARDNFTQKGCGGHGGRELFYKVTLAAAEVYYFDTLGSSFDSTVRVFPGKACTALNPQEGPACNDDACNGRQSQLAVELPAGTSCVVIDQNAGATTGTLALKVIAGGHFGDPLPPGPRTLTGDTCGSIDQWRGSCGQPGGNEEAYFFAVCPGVTAHVDASTCSDVNATHFDTIVYLRKAGVAQDVACNDDDGSCAARAERPGQPDGSVLTNAAAAGPGLFFLVVDGYDAGNCGGYSMTTDLR